MSDVQTPTDDGARRKAVVSRAAQALKERRTRRQKEIAFLRRLPLRHPEQFRDGCAKSELELKYAIALCMNETSGEMDGVRYVGACDIWGHEGALEEAWGQEVTPDNAREYEGLRGSEGLNGANNTQITDEELQDEARARGGLWNCEATAEVGLHFLHQLRLEYGDIFEAARAYNGSGPAAEAYKAEFEQHVRAVEGWMTAAGLKV